MKGYFSARTLLPVYCLSVISQKLVGAPSLLGQSDALYLVAFVLVLLQTEWGLYPQNNNTDTEFGS